jgi:hypothetical protein
MNKKLIHGLYNDDDIILAGVKTIRAKGIEIKEVFSPFPIHGLDHAMGLKPTRIAITAFIYGSIGLTLAIWMTKYMMIDSWPMNIGGKPSFSWLENMPAFVPIMFEITVLCAAHLMAITYLFRNKTYPGAKAENPDPRTTDDMFLMEIEVEGDTAEVLALLKETGAVEIKEVELA